MLKTRDYGEKGKKSRHEQDSGKRIATEKNRRVLKQIVFPVVLKTKTEIITQNCNIK